MIAYILIILLTLLSLVLYRITRQQAEEIEGYEYTLNLLMKRNDENGNE